MFLIKIPFVVATHVKKFAASSSLKNKQKAGAVGMVGGIVFAHNGTIITPVSGLYSSVVSGSGATVTLTAAQAGSLVLFDRAAGIIYTLPAPQLGLWYDFFVSTTITSNNATVLTDAATTFILGTVLEALEATAPSVTAGPFDFSGNGTTHVKVQMNGTTTGGIAGTYLRFAAISSTVWFCTGNVKGSGSIATPFSV